jgi:CheY-like chemotaxis protein
MIGHGDGTPASPAAAPKPSIKLDGRILLAEDGEDNQRLLMAFLKSAGVQVALGVDGSEAVRLAEEADYGFDLVLMDMQMPVMDGYQATAALRQAGYVRPIIAVTANAGAEDRAKAMAAGCSDYLTKPISKQVLLTTCAAHLKAATPDPAGAPSGQPATLNSSFANDARVAKVLDRFVARLPERVNQIRQCLDGGNLEALRQAVHNLKGAGSGYGFAALSEQSARTEDALRAQASLDRIRGEVDQLVQLLRRVSGYNPAAEGVTAPASAGG